MPDFNPILKVEKWTALKTGSELTTPTAKPLTKQNSTMSRFWAAGGSSSESESDDDSYTSSDSSVGGGGGGGRANENKWADLSDDSGE